jgi:hypothetical protein
MANRLIALVEHPAIEGDGARVDVETTRRMGTDTDGRRARTRRDPTPDSPRQLTVLGDDPGDPA